jgi:hypothetical protein
MKLTTRLAPLLFNGQTGCQLPLARAIGLAPPSEVRGKEEEIIRKAQGFTSPRLQEKRSGRTDVPPAQEREYALKQGRCLAALEEYFAEARKTVDLIRLCRREPGSMVAAKCQIRAQRDREAASYRSYTQARKLLLHTVKAK